MIGNKEARVRPIADLRRQVLNLWAATLLAEAQKVIDLYLARRGVLAANAIQKLENYRDKAAKSGTSSYERGRPKCWVNWSEREDLNLRPLVSQTSALTGLRHAPMPFH